MDPSSDWEQILTKPWARLFTLIQKDISHFFFSNLSNPLDNLKIEKEKQQNKDNTKTL